MNNGILREVVESIDSPFLLSVVLMLAVFFLTFKSEISEKLFNKKKKKVIIKRKISDLRNHDVFNTLKRIKLDVANMKFYTHKKFDRTKTLMCEDFTNTKSDVCGKYMIELLDYGIENMDRDKLKRTIVDLQIIMHEEYVNKIRNIWLAKKIETEDVEYIISLFEKFRYDVVNSFEHRINSIFGSANYKNNFALTLAVFEMWAMGIDLLPRDMQTTFENLNGKFHEIKY